MNLTKNKTNYLQKRVHLSGNELLENKPDPGLNII